MQLHIHHHHDFGPVNELVQQLGKVGTELMSEMKRLSESVAALAEVADQAIEALADQAQAGPLADQVDELRQRLAEALAPAQPAEPEPAPAPEQPVE